MSPSIRFAGALGGAVFIAIGFTFLWAYAEPERNRFCRALIWLCEHSSPPGRFMAWFYFALFVFVGAMSIITPH